jgi:hypothetical protein
MISEVDLADWDFKQLLKEAGGEIYTEDYLFDFLVKMEALQKQGQKQVAALLKPPKGIDG